MPTGPRNDRLSKAEIRKDALQDGVTAASHASARVATILTSAVSDIGPGHGWLRDRDLRDPRLGPQGPPGPRARQDRTRPRRGRRHEGGEAVRADRPSRRSPWSRTWSPRSAEGKLKVGTSGTTRGVACLPARRAAPTSLNSQEPRQGSAFALPFSAATTSRSAPGSSAGRSCQVEPLNGVRGAFLEMSVNRAERDRYAVQAWCSTTVRCTRSPVPWRRKSHRSFGIAHSSRPPSRESAESTQMSVMFTRRPPAAFTGRATSSSE